MTVYRRGAKGTWYCDFIIKGRRVKESTRRLTRREALAYEARRRAEVLDEMERPAHQRRSSLCLGEAVKRCYEERWKRTKDGDQSLSRALLMADLLGPSRRLEEISSEEVSRMVSHLRNKGRTPATINRYLAALKTILRMAWREWAALDRVPFIRMEKERNGRLRTVSLKEERHLLSFMTKKGGLYLELSDVYVVLVDTGMRLSEVLRLSERDVDLSTNMIAVWENKGDRPRSVPMTARVRAVVEHRLSQGQPELFPLGLFQAEYLWRKLRKAMGLQKDRQFVLHALRHTCASRMVQAGVDLYTVKEILGHSSIQVTERYAHLAPHRLAHGIEALESYRQASSMG